MNKNTIDNLNLCIQDGTLVDKDGFSYERVRRGTINSNNLYFSYNNTRVNLYSNDLYIIRCGYAELNQIEKVAPFDTSADTFVPMPCNIDTIESIRFFDSGKLLFYVAPNMEKNTNTKLYPIYRDLTNGELETLNYNTELEIICVKTNLSDITFS